MADMFTPAPEPSTELGRYRILSSTAGIRVSPLQLGAMSIGDGWDFMGHMNKEQSFKLLDAFVESGGNFIDTANNYQDELSEKWIGEWMKERNNRDQLVLADKYTLQYRAHEMGKGGKVVNYAGNSRRSLHMSVRDSLKKLQTDWIDLFYLHVWDYTTSIEEIMDSLHVLVQSGKVLYLGISDTPAWIVSACNYYARANGKTPFSVYQGRWNVLARDFERDIIPMANHFGMALAPWDVLAGGKFQTKKALEERKAAGESLRGGLAPPEQSEEQKQMSEALAKVAAEHGIESVTAIALAYVMCKTPRVFPIVGGRKVEHLKDNLAALKIKLTEKQIEYLESVKPFDIGFPINMIGHDPAVTGKPNPLLAATAPVAYVMSPKAIGHE